MFYLDVEEEKKLTPQKAKIMYLYRILQRKSDREHRLTVSDMIEELAEYGIKAERKSVYSDIAILREMGYHIVMHRSREVSYYLEPSPLSVDDLKLLTDAVNTSSFIPARKTNELKKKLSLLTSEKNARVLDRPLFFPDRRTGEKEQAYQKTEIIRKAMSGDVRLNFDYSDPDAEEQHSQRFRNVSPYCLVWFERRFYLVAGSDDFEEGLRSFSVRGLTNLVPLSVPREKLFVYSGDVDFNMQYYVNGIFSSEADIEQFPD